MSYPDINIKIVGVDSSSITSKFDTVDHYINCILTDDLTPRDNFEPLIGFDLQYYTAYVKFRLHNDDYLIIKPDYINVIAEAFQPEGRDTDFQRNRHLTFSRIESITLGK